ncbi:MAG: hypothetical protein U0Y82_01085 [Thermoleophilia bacterium]
MKRRHPRLLICALGLAALGSTVPAAAAATFTQFSAGVVTDARPLNIARGADGDMWFTYALGSGSLARITADGVVTDLSGTVPADRRPYDLTLGPDGAMWFTESAVGRIGRLAPDGTYAEFSAGLGADSVPKGITAGPDGNLWFTLSGGTGGIGRITPAGVITVFTAGMAANGGAVDIVAGSDGNLWYTNYNNYAIGRITTSGTITEFGAGLAFWQRPANMVLGPDGNVWVGVQMLGAVITRVEPSGAATSFGAAVSQIDEPAGIGVGADGNIWWDDQVQNAVGYVTPQGNITLATTSPAPLEPQGMAADAQGNLWFVAGGAPARVWRIGIAKPEAGTVTVTPTTTGATVKLPVNPNGQPTTVHVDATAGAATRSAEVTTGSTSSASHTVTLSLTGLTAGTQYRYRITVTNGSGAATVPQGTFATRDTSATANPTPVVGTSVLMAATQGTVTVRTPGSAGPVPLGTTGGTLPVGTVVDASAGRVRLTLAMPGGGTQTGRFWGARFTVRQTKGTGLTTIVTDRTLWAGCTTAALRGVRAARKPPRVLWGHDSGARFTTRGHNSVATVRGTTWSTTETCTGTLTRVTEGSVAVRDLRTRRTRVVTAGGRYLARTRGVS